MRRNEKTLFFRAEAHRAQLWTEVSMRRAQEALREAITATHTMPPDEKKAFANDLQELAAQAERTSRQLARQPGQRFWWGAPHYAQQRDAYLKIRKVFQETTWKLECLVESRWLRLDDIALFLEDAHELSEALWPYMKLDGFIEKLRLLERQLAATRGEIQKLALWESFDRIASLERAAGHLFREADRVIALMDDARVDYGFTTNRVKMIRKDLMHLVGMVNRLEEAALDFKPQLRFDGRNTPEELQRQLEAYHKLRKHIESHLNRDTFIRNAIARFSGPPVTPK